MHGTRVDFALRVVAVGVALAAIAGCTPAGPTFVDEGNTYATESARALVDRPAPPSLVRRPSADAPELRHEALVRLRAKGGPAAAAADQLTATFSADTRGVPYYVELASVDDTQALIAIESVGPKDGELVNRRLWVLSIADGSVLASFMR